VPALDEEVGLRRGTGHARRLALAAVLAAAILTWATPAGAETTVGVQVGVDGAHIPGEPVAVRAIVEADRLIEGDLVITSRSSTGSQTITRPIEVPGGSVKQFTVLVGTQMWESPRITVTVEDGSERVASDSVNLSASPDTELVGILPVLNDSIDVPESADLALESGEARFGAVDGALLDLGRDGLAGFDILVGTEADVADLGEAQRQGLLLWVATGGVLLLDSPASGSVDGLPEDAQPGVMGWQRVGEGTIRLVDGAASAEQWDEILFPTSTAGASQDGQLVIEGPAWNGGFSILSSLAVDAGFRLPQPRDLMLLLLVYALLVGPITAFILRRTHKRTLAWVTVPVLAGIFTGIVYVQGEDLRSASGSSHSTLIEVTPYGATATTNLLIGSRNGGWITVDAPMGWRGDRLLDPWGMDVDMLGGTKLESTVDGDSTELAIELDPGEFQGLRVEGALPAPPPVTVEAVSAADGRVTVTVRNDLDVALHDVGVFVEDHSQTVEEISAGESVDVQIEELDESADAASVDSRVWEELEDPWNDPDMRFDPFGRPLPDDDIEEGDLPDVDAGLWTDYLANRGYNVRTPGEVMVVGWSSEMAAPVQQEGRQIDRGRTGVVVRAPVKAGGDRLTAVPVGRELVRSGGEAFPMGPVFAEPARIAELSDLRPGEGIFRMSLPADRDGEPIDLDRLVIDLPEDSRRVRLWNGEEWQNLFAGLQGRRVVEVSEAAVIDGAIYLELRSADIWRRDDGKPDLAIYELPEGSDLEVTTTERLDELDEFFEEYGDSEDAG
jgi:hypothetical protein